MPRYLRYITAATVSVTAYFVLAIGLGVAFIGRGSKPRPLNGAVGLLVSLIADVFPVLAALLVNDWLAGKYPVPPKRPARAESAAVPAEPFVAPKP